MAHLLSDLVSYFALEEINIDNWVFKLYYKVSTILCMLGASIGVAQGYFGKPITCMFNGINSELADDFCWMHGSSYIPSQYQAHMKCIVDQSGVVSEDTAPETQYYQWVTFVFAIQAAVFYMPFKIWSALEGGLIASFGTDAQSKVMVSKDADLGDGSLVLEALTDKFVKYFKCVFHRNTWYFGYFVSCEILNYALLMIQFVETNKFLNGKFSWYGLEVIDYLSLSRNERKLSINPMCATFPTEVSCNIGSIGAAGGDQNSNGLCVLTQNIINEKMYLIFWFWYVFLGFISILAALYRLSTIVSGNIRFALIYKTIRHKFDGDLKGHLESILDQGQIGDWFVLYQLSKNSNPYFYREFIRELAKDLKQKPKTSLSTTAGKAPQKVKDQSTSNNKVLSMLSLAHSSIGNKPTTHLPQSQTPNRMSMLSISSQLPPPVSRMSMLSNISHAPTLGTPRGMSVASEDSHVVITIPSVSRDDTFSSTPPDSPRNSVTSSAMIVSGIGTSSTNRSSIAESPTASKRSSKSSV
eukprot:GFUD01011593.1.p1 GENE.GFUD01011593.1~~GFUD01011593.1.p1  ORF type:complete len:526 (+),score=111.55 GFUD01011593.1:72-1649(+)